jgi:hypothetical protein
MFSGTCTSRCRCTARYHQKAPTKHVEDPEKLDVYRIALEFVVTTVEIKDRLPRGNGELQDQFKRASFSLVLNIAEGAGKLKQADKRR